MSVLKQKGSTHLSSSELLTHILRLNVQLLQKLQNEEKNCQNVGALLVGSDANDLLVGSGGNDTLYGGAGNDILYGAAGDDALFIGTGNNLVIGGEGIDTAIYKGRPIDYRFHYNIKGQFISRHKDSNELAILLGIEKIKFQSVANKAYTEASLLENEFLTDRRDISIYGDTTLNRMVVMKLSAMKMIQEISVDAESVYSADYVSADKSYITPRGSNFFVLLHRNADGKFVKGKKVALPFAPRTPNRGKNNGLILFSGANKPMFALIDSKTDQVVVTGGRDEVTLGNFDNYDSKWATGHAQWINDEQFILPDRENYKLSLYRVSKENNIWKAEETDAVVPTASVHTFFGKRVLSNGDITIFSPGEGHGTGDEPNDNSDAYLYELKISGDHITIHRQLNVAGGLHHPGLHPEGHVIYVPTSNGQVQIVDRDSFDVINTLQAGKDAGHVVFIKERNLALIVNHSDTFMTAIDTTTHQKIKDFEVAKDDPDHSTSLQAHTGRVSPDKKYFYNFASDSGTFFRVNLDTLEVDKTVYTGGTPKQASQPGELGSGH